jgi:hypothetical protein
MISTQILNFDNCDCAEGIRVATKCSIDLANVFSFPVIETKLGRVGNHTDSSIDAIHFVSCGTILFPDFYREMLTTLEYTRMDYVACQAGVLNFSNGKSMILKAGELGFECSQIIVRRWVYEELGDFESSPIEFVKKVIVDYRGCEVPQVLLMKV